ncbi:MAG TPA: A/G-specific adenine glycosylase [Patescibacteria group bacterium]|nr:A/G-specific adenine glycosylase [Patescibacteria group bacterium]
MNGAKESAFQKEVWQYYHTHGRHDLPWRRPEADGRLDPYKVLVSEIMLQQTQVPRVIPKFEAFIRQFPSFTVLAAAPLGDVLKAWSGLGYNRRAKFLWQTAQAVAGLPDGQLPITVAELSKLPGIGKNTAGAVLAYAFNKPVVFIETNIRTVFIHHFFADGQLVHDRDIADIVAKELPDNPREWYWALMDYGVNLKQTSGNASRKSAHYTKQTAFVGSKRQVRGLVLKVLGEQARTASELSAKIADERLGDVLGDLLSEGLIIKQADKYML